MAGRVCWGGLAGQDGWGGKGGWGGRVGCGGLTHLADLTGLAKKLSFCRVKITYSSNGLHK